MTYKDFEDYLRFKHSQTYRGLDDDMPDAYEDWLSNLSGERYITYADDYAKQIIKDLTIKP